MDKVNETIEVLCDWIQRQLNGGKCDMSHEVSEMVKALAELISVSMNHKGSSLIHAKASSTQNAIQGRVGAQPVKPEDLPAHTFGLPPDDIFNCDRKGDQ